MTVAFQGSLLDLSGEKGPAPLAGSVRRTVLSGGAWADVRPNWLAGADDLFGRLLRVVPWRAERRHMYDRVFSLAIGALLRHTAGAISTAIGVVFVLPIIAVFLPGDWGQRVHDYLPTVAGAMLAQARQGLDQVLTPWQGFAVFCAWTAVLLAAAFYLLRRRDA